MLQSQLFAKTLREAPRGAEAPSHKYLVRGDFISQLASGIYRLLPLGWRVYKKIENIIDQEMKTIGGQRILLTTLQPKSLWQESGRWNNIEPPLFKLKDIHGKQLALASTHEEDITDLVRRRVATYKDLPFSLYQIQNKFRNETRATGGLLRVREFIMKDLYSFHTSREDLVKYYNKVKIAYSKIFKRCGFKAFLVEADPGTIGGKLSYEFMVLSKLGEDKVFICKNCGYAANQEVIKATKKCPKCSKNTLEKKSSIELGHLFYLGTKYSKILKATFLDKDEKTKPIIMGCYGIGLGRLMASIVEVFHDEKGIIWPESVAPYKVHLLSIGKDKEVAKKSQVLYNELIKQNIDVLYDDRKESPGVKFADSDLIGIPIRLVVSKKTLEKSSVEVKRRDQKKTRLVKTKDLIKQLKNNV